MNVMLILGIVQVVALVGILFVGFQLRDRLERISTQLEKK